MNLTYYKPDRGVSCTSILTGKMNQEIKKRWIKALTDGTYTQATGVLAENIEEKCFCCLGVLNDISEIGEWIGESYSTIEYITPMDISDYRKELDFMYGENAETYFDKNEICGEADETHCDVQKWAGLPDTNPEIVIPAKYIDFLPQVERYNRNSDGSVTVPIATANDAGLPFEVLAELINEQY